MIVASLGAAVWLGITGQTFTIDGLFLTLTVLLTALVFVLYIVFMIRRAIEAQAKPATAKAPAAKPPSNLGQSKAAVWA